MLANLVSRLRALIARLEKRGPHDDLPAYWRLLRRAETLLVLGTRSGKEHDLVEKKLFDILLGDDDGSQATR